MDGLNWKITNRNVININKSFKRTIVLISIFLCIFIFYNFLSEDATVKAYIQPNVHEIGPDDYMNPAADENKSYAYNYGYWVGMHLANNYTNLNMGLRNLLNLNNYLDVEDALENLSIFRNLTSPEPNSYENEYIDFLFEEFEGLRDGLKDYEDLMKFNNTNNSYRYQCTSTLSTGCATNGDYAFLSQNLDIYELSTPYFHYLKEFTNDESGSSEGGF